MGKGRDGRSVGVSSQLKIAIKIFSDRVAFSNELRAYEVLSRNRCPYIPTFYGSFHNDLLGVSSILISYGRPVAEGFSFTQNDRQDCPLPHFLPCLVSMGTIFRDHLVAAVSSLHSFGVHHHDLKPDNLVQGEDGKLKMIDFHLSEILTEASCPQGLCPDWQWIQEGF